MGGYKSLQTKILISTFHRLQLNALNRCPQYHILLALHQNKRTQKLSNICFLIDLYAHAPIDS